MAVGRTGEGPTGPVRPGVGPRTRRMAPGPGPGVWVSS